MDTLSPRNQHVNFQVRKLEVCQMLRYENFLGALSYIYHNCTKIQKLESVILPSRGRVAAIGLT